MYYFICNKNVWEMLWYVDDSNQNFKSSSLLFWVMWPKESIRNNNNYDDSDNFNNLFTQYNLVHDSELVSALISGSEGQQFKSGQKL